VQGGVSLGHSVTNACLVVDSPQGIPLPGQTTQSSSFNDCKVVVPLAGYAQVKGAVSYPGPWSTELSAVYINIAGPPIQAAVTLSDSQIASSLGRPTCQRAPRPLERATQRSR
jgi:hypothetical protein